MYTEIQYAEYNKNIQLARRITGKGYYISLGKALQRPGIQEVLRVVPANRFFLETDDAEISIGEIYQLAAKALSIDHNSLVLQMQKNTETVFGNALQL